MKIVSGIMLFVCVMLLFYPPLYNKAQVQPKVIPYQFPSAQTIKEKKKTDSLEAAFLAITQERDKKILLLVDRMQRVESENSLLKKRLKIGAISKVQSTNAKKKIP